MENPLKNIEKLQFTLSSNDARIAAVFIGLGCWTVVAIMTSNSPEPSMARLAGPISTILALAVAVVSYFFFYAGADSPRYARYLKDMQAAYDRFRSAVNTLGNLVVYVALLPIVIGVAIWAVAYLIVLGLAAALKWPPASFDPDHVLMCFLVGWVYLSAGVVIACWLFGMSRVLHSNFWRAVDYPWVLTSTVAIIITIQDTRLRDTVQALPSHVSFSPEQRWDWYLTLAILVAFRMTRTTAEILRDLEAFKARLPPSPGLVFAELLANVRTASDRLRKSQPPGK